MSIAQNKKILIGLKSTLLLSFAFGSICFGQSKWDAISQQPQSNNLSSVANGTSQFVDSGNCKATCIGKGTIVFESTLPADYVEVFVRQNGIQNVAQKMMVDGDPIHGYNGSYRKFISSGYKAGDVVEYRFYSYVKGGPSVFTPGPIENSWNKLIVDSSSFIAPVTKDATLLYASYAGNGGPNDNFGSNSSVLVGVYHATSNGALGFGLSGIPSDKVVTEALLVLPDYSAAQTNEGGVYINKINNSTSWQESTVTWNNSPEYTFYKFFDLPFWESLAYTDITEIVSSAVLAGEKEISIMFTGCGTNNYGIASKENSAGKAAYIYIKTR